MMDLFEKNIFRVGGLLLLTFHATAHSASLNPANPWGIRMDIGYTYDDNVSRSSESKLSDNIFSLNLSKGAVVPVSEHTRLLFNGLLGAEKFGTHTGLGRAFAGIHGELMYRASGEFSTPTWAIFGRAFADEYQSALRDGYRFSGGVSARKPVTDRVTLIGALARNVRKAESSVFDTKDTALRMNLDYAVTSSGTLYASGEHRRGDIVFSMKSDVTGVGDTHQLDDALTGVTGVPYTAAVHLGSGSTSSGTQYFGYRIQGKTALITLGYNLAFGSRSSLDLSWRRVRSTPDAQAGYTPPNYTSNQYFIAYLMTF